MQFTYLLF